MEATLTEYLDRLVGLKVLVVGDAMRDVYHFGRIDRLSPEAPVPIFIEERQETRMGGALNVERNLVALGCDVSGCYAPSYSLKHRYMVGHHLLLRIDEDAIVYPTKEEVEAAYDDILVWQPSAVVISDYAKGFASSEMCKRVIEAANAVSAWALVDPKGADWSKYHGASMVCPNVVEMKQWNKHYDDRPGMLFEKLGVDGARLTDMLLGDTRSFKAQARQVFDVTGAGDTVIAVLAAMVGAGATPSQAAEVAMLAAGHVVGEVGTSVCSIATLRQLVKEYEAKGRT